MNLQTKQKGFTIVELLIVIVVIAILAAISIVAYNGIQNRGKASSAQSLASQVAKKAQAYNTVESKFPAAVSDFAAVNESKLDDDTKVTNTQPENENTVQYTPCPASGTGDKTGARITWFDATKSGTDRYQNIEVGSGC